MTFKMAVLGFMLILSGALVWQRTEIRTLKEQQDADREWQAEKRLELDGEIYRVEQKQKSDSDVLFSRTGHLMTGKWSVGAQ